MTQYRKVGNTQILPNGNLKITAGNEARAMIAEGFQRDGYYGAEQVVGELLHEAYDFVVPEAIAALTDAPILCATDDIDASDDQNYPFPPLPDAPVFWFPDYCVRDPWAELKNKGFVIFERAPQ